VTSGQPEWSDQKEIELEQQSVKGSIGWW